MAGHIDKKEIIYMLILVSFVMGVFFFYKGQYFLNDMFRDMDGVHKTPIITNKSASKRVYQKNVEAVLNQMLSDVYNEMKSYRERRKILSDIVKPENLRNAQYINESYQLTQQTIPNLQSRSNKIIKIFASKEAEIKVLIKDRPQAAQNNILSTWNKMKKEQVNLYVQYFTIEQDILSKYQGLMALYYQHQNGVIYYQETNTTAFKSPNLNAQSTRLSEDIQTLMKKQAALSK